SEQYVRLATDPALAKVSGMYFVCGKEKPEGSSALSLDPAVQERIDDAAEAWAAPFLTAYLVSAPDDAIPDRERGSIRVHREQWMALAGKARSRLMSKAHLSSKSRRLS